MKKVILSVTCGFLFVLGLAHNFETQAIDLVRIAKFNWNNTSYDFGKIEQSKPVKAKFSFTNTGDKPLIITSVKASCGCTVADYTEGEILPGQKGKVTATYNAAKAGIFNKTVTVNANVDGDPILLKLKGEVVK